MELCSSELKRTRDYSVHIKLASDGFDLGVLTGALRSARRGQGGDVTVNLLVNTSNVWRQIPLYDSFQLKHLAKKLYILAIFFYQEQLNCKEIAKTVWVENLHFGILRLLV